MSQKPYVNSTEICDKPKDSESRRLLPAWLATCSDVGNESKSLKTTCDKGDLDVIEETPQMQLTKNLPYLKFHGKIHYHTSVGEASEACKEIRSLLSPKHMILGFDLEWTPNFQLRREPCTAVLQLCSDHFNCHIFHLAFMTGFPVMLRLLIEDENVIKVGVGIENDMWKLGRNFLFPAKSIIERSIVDLSELANKILKCSQQWSLERLVQHVLNLGLPKDRSIRCGNWNQYPLTQEQLEYAALDAYASLLLYEDLKSIEEANID